MLLQGRETPAHHPHNPDAPHPGGGGRPAHPKPTKPAHHKPAHHKPVHHKPTKPAHHKPEHQGKKTAGRGEVELIWFDDIVYAPLAKGGHIPGIEE